MDSIVISNTASAAALLELLCCQVMVRHCPNIFHQNSSMIAAPCETDWF